MVLFVVILVASLTTDSDALTASEIVAGKLASTVSTATVIPAKGSNAARRRKLETELGAPKKRASHDKPTRKPLTLANILPGSKPNPYTAHLNAFNPNLRRLALSTDPTVASDSSEFSDLSDYRLTTDPQMSVSDESASYLDLINAIGCSIGQVRLFEVGMNTSCNPGRLPFTSLINDNLCDSTVSTFSEWYVFSVDGPDGGDGTYTSELLINWQNSLFVSANHKAIISGGNKIYDGIDFTMEQYISGTAYTNNGVLIMEFDPDSGDASVQWEQQLGGTQTEYLYATYNSETFEGDAISGDTDTTYRLKITENNILREATDVSTSSTTTSCIDFAIESQVLVDSSYRLFSAMDGSSLAHQTGFPVQMTVDGYDSPLLAYIDYWGLSVNGYVDDAGSIEDASTTAANWVNGATVEKLVDDGTDNTYTLGYVPARLEKVSKQSVPLSDIIGLPLTINNYGNDYEGYVIAWNGTDFVKRGEKTYYCVDWSGNSDEKLAMNFEPTRWSDCLCVDGNGDLTTSGSVDYNQQVYRSSYTSVSSEEFFPISSNDFSRGIEVKAGELYGQLGLSYDVIQKLYFNAAGTYTAGDTVTQGSITGTVTESTAKRLYGLEWTSGSDTGIIYAMEGNDCGGSGGSDMTLPILFKGMKVTQANSGATALVAEDCHWLGEGLAIESITGTWTTASADTISISIPSDWDNEMSSMIVSAAFASGEGLAFSSTNTLSDMWPSVEVTPGVNCVTTVWGDITDSDITGITGGVVSVYIDTSDSDNHRFYAWVSNPGTSCDSSTLAVDPTNLLSCDTYPTYTVKCTVREEAASSSVKVTLDDKSAPFVTSRSPWENSNEVTIGGTAVGTPFWSHKEVGDVVKPSGTTTIDYQIRSLVVPGDVVPELACYNNCPKLSASASQLTTCSLEAGTCYEDEVSTITGFQVDSDVSCTGDANGVTSGITLSSSTSGAGALTSINDLALEWSSEQDSNGDYTYYLDAVEFATGSNGAGCDTDSMTIKLDATTSSVCTADITITGYCESNHDGMPVGSSVTAQLSTLYTFDSESGYLTDKASGNTQSGGPSSEDIQFGPFFENVVANYNALECDWSSEILCPYEVYQELTEYYEYRSGPYSNRALLIGSDGSNVVVDAPKLMTYTHSGTGSNSGKSYDGTTFLLEYTGQGGESIRGMPNYCIDSAGAPADCDPFQTTQVQDINIPATATLKSIDSSTLNHLYYALPSIQEEYYPTTSASACSSMTLDTLTLPDFDSSYTTVPQRNVPSHADLEANYALGGAPLSISGEALFEVEGTDGQCRV